MKLHPGMYLVLIFGLIFGVLIMAGCSDQADTGRVSLALTDAPYPVDMIARAEIDVVGASVHIEADDDDGWHPLPVEPATFDLLQLQNGVTGALADGEVPVGRITEIRLLIASGEIELSDERIFPLTVPSGASSGLKLKVRPPIEVEGDLTSEILVDMDVARSFLPIPASPNKVEEIERFHFEPTVRVANLSTTGSVSGYVLSTNGTSELEDDDPIAGASVLVHADGDSSTTFTDLEGYYRVLGLDSRTWLIEASAAGFDAATTSVGIVAANDVRADSLRLEPVVPE